MDYNNKHSVPMASLNKNGAHLKVRKWFLIRFDFRPERVYISISLRRNIQKCVRNPVWNDRIQLNSMLD